MQVKAGATTPRRRPGRRSGTLPVRVGPGHVMKRLRAWYQWRRDIGRLQRDLYRAAIRVTRARDAYQDTAVVFGDVPGAWGSAGPCGAAQDAVTDLRAEYERIAERLRRLHQDGPGR